MKRTNLRELPTECVGSFLGQKSFMFLKVVEKLHRLSALSENEMNSNELFLSQLFKDDIRIWSNIEKLVVVKDQLDSVVFIGVNGVVYSEI